MIGCRPLSDAEIEVVSGSFTGKYALRDRALYLLGIYSGYRISELLSIRVKDVVQYGELVERVTVQRKSMKGKNTLAIHDLQGTGDGGHIGQTTQAQQPLYQWIIPVVVDVPQAPEAQQ